jgi:NAD+ synthase
MKCFNIKPGSISKKLEDFISDTTDFKGFSRVIMGLSGGLDSTVVAYLSARALGSSNVTGVIMPYGKLAPEALDHARKIAKTLNIKTEVIDIAPMVNIYFDNIKTTDSLRYGNKMARERMSILYDLSQKYKALVIGTSNRTEILLGYGTIYGDCACAINPIGGLYKTQVRALAGHLGIPSYILKKTPSADLWDGQTDEGEIGYKYSDIDRLLFFMIDKKLKNKQLIKKGFKRKFIEDIRAMIRKNKFKSQLPVVAKL